MNETPTLRPPVELKPCPWCAPDKTVIQFNGNFYMGRFWCSGCGALGPMIKVPLENSERCDDSVRADAAEAWNRRPEDATDAAKWRALGDEGMVELVARKLHADLKRPEYGSYMYAGELVDGSALIDGDVDFTELARAALAAITEGGAG